MLLFLYFCVPRIEVPFDRHGNFLHIFCLFPRLFFFLIPSLDPNLGSLGRRSCRAQMSSLRVLLASGALLCLQSRCVGSLTWSWKGALRVQAPGAGRGAELVEMGVPVGPRAALTLLRSLARPACSWEVWKVSLWTLSHWGGGRPTNLCKWSRTCALGVDSRAAAGSPSPFLLDS